MTKIIFIHSDFFCTEQIKAKDSNNYLNVLINKFSDKFVIESILFYSGNSCTECFEK